METKKLEELKKEILVNKIVEIRPIIRRKAYLKADHDGHHTYTGCHKGEGLPFDSGKRSYLNPFLDSDEQGFFEKMLNRKEGSLNLYNYKITEPNFWGEFTLKIPKEGIKLDLQSPKDALMYRVLKVNPRFASNRQEAGKAECVYQLLDEEAEKKEVSLLAKKQETAHDFLHEIKKSKKKMLDVLKLMGKSADKDSDIDWLKDQFYKIISETSTAKGVVGIDKFIEVMKDPILSTKVFVLDAIESGDIVKTQSGYKLEDSNTFLGLNFKDTVEYFLSKDPKIQEIVLIIKEKLKY